MIRAIEQFACICGLVAFGGAVAGVLGSIAILVLEDAWIAVREFFK